MNGFIVQIDTTQRVKTVYWREPVFFIDEGKTLADYVVLEQKTLELLTDHIAFHAMSLKDGFKGDLYLQRVKNGFVVLFLHYSEGEHFYEPWPVLMQAIGELRVDTAKEMERQLNMMQLMNNRLANLQRELAMKNQELKQHRKRLLEQLRHDGMTGLISHELYQEAIGDCISRQPEKKGIFMFLDLDNFKSINDQYDHQSGDLYLKQFARLLLDCFVKDQTNCLALRLGGDEFGVFIHGFDDVTHQDCIEMWQRLSHAVRQQPVCLKGTHLQILFSSGFSVYGQDTTDVVTLVNMADSAMYVSKKRGRNCYTIYSMHNTQ